MKWATDLSGASIVLDESNILSNSYPAASCIAKGGRNVVKWDEWQPIAVVGSSKINLIRKRFQNLSVQTKE